MNTGLHLDFIYRKHHPMGGQHPESFARIEGISKALHAAGLVETCEQIPLREATDEEILLVHGKAYLALAKTEIASGASDLSTGDTSISTGSMIASRNAAGSLLEAVDMIATKKIRNAFCAVRPPGHHVTKNRGMGFGVINNVAMAARYAQSKHGFNKVAIVDWDVHHGNGTHDIFYSDPGIFYFSTHQSPHYPGTGPKSDTGSGKGKGFTMNRPFPASSGMKEISSAFDEFLTKMETFQPDLILISAGFDSRKGDPLGDFLLTDEDFASLTKTLMDCAKKHCKSRVASILEGGYSINGLSSAVTAHVKQLSA